ncbi:cytochrome c [Bartonella australis AUST/NH1]|uniref:Cytochrome c n=1 Tax=Bartonella australis (strain Aust/NH1) TaxID=1094489 RepID=M1P2M8_BARAA|nr:cytochrome c family protein [Bartonella australis]AGF74055.1 cytochrome c [Bartonella australis AUST/NH1]
MNRFMFACCICACMFLLIVWMVVSIIGDVLYNDYVPIDVSRRAVDGEALKGTQHISRTPLLLSDRLQQGDLENGRKIFKQCALCHTSGRNGVNRVGPTLWGVIDRPFAAVEGFSYSRALRENSDKKWNFFILDRYIRSPRTTIPGTTMSFRGIKDDQDRADLLLYLRSLSDEPVPLPLSPLEYEDSEKD